MSDRLAVPCPTCGGVIDFDYPHVGREIDCPECGEAFRLTSLDPTRVGYAFDADEEVMDDADTHPRG